ncbi:protein phosphatase 2C 16-like [Salvia miltiorrhiza]|uniref:protein phosphatase 2C 16-like n=1 Tax=Salvia miltiorrhiza TaxID=226208 RepID=UPI0025AB8849|nr:protein phosphatase 2C 16-like [Salvia miltiorrhiza]XP_057771228.1 protein phosphatase 2C 16-like [Salvia miltiorrhiza]
MDGMCPAIAVTVSLGSSPACETHKETARLKLETEAAMVLDDNSCSSLDNDVSVMPGVGEAKHDLSQTRRIAENGQFGSDVQESEEDEVLSIGEDPNFSSVELLPLDSSSNLSVPLDTAPESSLPIAVEIEGVDNGQIVAKVISVEERNTKQRLSHDALAVATRQDEECSSGPTIKASVVSLKLSGEKDPSKGGVKSVYELDCLPLWGSVSIIGHRPEMEDAIVAVPHFMKIPIKMFIGDYKIDGISQTLTHLTSHFFGVYDGHGGSQVANYCRERLHLALKDEIINVKDNLVNGSTQASQDARQVQWDKVFNDCFLKVDGEVSGKVSRAIPVEDAKVSNCASEPVAPETVGSTAVVAVVCSSHIIVANCGDSRAVLYRGKEPITLSVDHKPNREDEYARIEAAGGKVIQWNGHRVFGVLAMSRSIGDRYLKPWIIPEPEVMFVPRAREDECLVLASDGLWDVMTNEEVCDLARKRILIWHKKNGTNPTVDRGQGVDPAAQAAAEYLSNVALHRGSKDNISIIVVDLKAQRKFKSKS